MTTPPNNSHRHHMAMQQEATAEHPFAFHRAMSIRQVQINDSEHSTSRRSSVNSSDYDEQKRTVDYEDEHGDVDDGEEEEFHSLISPPPIPPPSIDRPSSQRHPKPKFQPFDITTPQQEHDEQRINHAFVRIPSVHLTPRIRGSFRKSRRRYQRSSCDSCCDSCHHCGCGWYTMCGTSWSGCGCRLLLVLLIFSVMMYVMQQQIVWRRQGTGDGFVRPKQQQQVLEDDDVIVNLAKAPSSRIRGDYSTVQNTDDLMALAANVPAECLDEHSLACPCAAVHQRDNPNSVINTRIAPLSGTALGWNETHARNVQLANLQAVDPPEIMYESDIDASDSDVSDNNQTSSEGQNTRSLSMIAPNVVFLGDSITERWQGTQLGKVESADMEKTHNVFVELFQSDSTEADPPLLDATAPAIHGIPLGIAGDQTPNLLWRLQNGELPETLHPNIFVVLIGTNDLSKDGCSAENVVVGVVTIVEWLLQEREDAMVLLHGLFPRTFEEDGALDPGNGHNWGNVLHHHNDDDEDHTEDPTQQHHFWPDIQIINDELQGYALFRDRVKYMDTNAFFVDLSGYHLSSGKLKLDLDLMPDGLHPSSDGYRIWGNEIKAKLQEMISTVEGD